MSEPTDNKAATNILNDVFGAKREMTPEMEDTEMFVPAIHMARKALLRIEKQGGKVDASIVGMLSSAAMLQELLALQPNIIDAKRARHETRQEVATTLADELVSRDLVELPVVARGRGRG